MATGLKTLSPIEQRMQDEHGNVTPEILLRELEQQVSLSRINAEVAARVKLVIETTAMVLESRGESFVEVYAVKALRRDMEIAKQI